MLKSLTILLLAILSFAPLRAQTVREGTPPAESRPTPPPVPHYQWDISAVGGVLPKGGMAGLETVHGVRYNRFFAGAGLGVFGLFGEREHGWPTSVALLPSLDLKGYLAVHERTEVYLDMQLGVLCPLAHRADSYMQGNLGFGARIGRFDAGLYLATLDFSSAGVMLKLGVAF